MRLVGMSSGPGIVAIGPEKLRHGRGDVSGYRDSIQLDTVSLSIPLVNEVLVADNCANRRRVA